MRCLLNGCLLVGCLLLNLTGCGGGTDDAVPPAFSPKRPKLLTTGASIGDQRVFAKGVRHFGMDLYRKLDGETGNVVFSPYGVHGSIAVLTHGMARPARDRVREVIEVELPEVRFESAASSVLDGVFADADTLNYFHLGTALWLQEGLTFKEKYLRRIVDFYAQQLYASDFKADSEQVVDDINEWASQQSSGWIKQLVSDDQITSNAKLISTQVMVVKADWKYAFDRHATGDAEFHLAEGKSVAVPTMHLNANLAYTESAHWQVVYLPYRKGKYGMFILVPKKRGGLASATETIDGKELTLLMDSLKVRPVSLALPRFAFTSRLSLDDKFRAMKMDDLFDQSGEAIAKVVEQADTPISTSAFMSTVRIEVKEAGEEQASAAGADATKDGTAKHVTAVKCDQPFFFFVRHHATGAILLMGRVVDPRSE